MCGLEFYPFHRSLDVTDFLYPGWAEGVNQNRRKASTHTSWSFAVAESGYLPTWLGLDIGKSQGCLAPDPAPSAEAPE